MPVEIRYRGLRIASGELEGDGNPGFMRHETPLPVGTRVVVHAEGASPREAIVAQVVEQDSSAKLPAGMKLRWAPVEAVASPPEAVPEPADSATRTTAMPAVSVPDEGEPEADPGEVEPADSPKRTLVSMPAIRDVDPGQPVEEPEPEGGGGGGRRRRRKQR